MSFSLNNGHPCTLLKTYLGSGHYGTTRSRLTNPLLRPLHTYFIKKETRQPLRTTSFQILYRQSRKCISKQLDISKMNSTSVYCLEAVFRHLQGKETDSLGLLIEETSQSMRRPGGQNLQSRIPEKRHFHREKVYLQFLRSRGVSSSLCLTINFCICNKEVLEARARLQRISKAYRWHRTVSFPI